MAEDLTAVATGVIYASQPLGQGNKTGASCVATSSKNKHRPVRIGRCAVFNTTQ